MRQLHKLKISRDQIFCRSAKTDLRFYDSNDAICFAAPSNSSQFHSTRRDATYVRLESNYYIVYIT